MSTKKEHKDDDAPKKVHVPTLEELAKRVEFLEAATGFKHKEPDGDS